MIEISVFRASNTIGLAINNHRITKTKPYGFAESIFEFKVDENDILKALDKPIRYGKWLSDHNYRDSEGDICTVYKCSYCEKKQNNYTPPYCPECGTKMILEE